MKRGVQLFLIALSIVTAAPLSAQLNIPEINYDSADLLKLPDHVYLGEAVGVATNSKGHIFVFTRSGENVVSIGTSRAFLRGGSRLFEFDPTGKFVKEWGVGMYGFTFAHVVRVDKDDNVWVVDEGANTIVKFDQNANVLMVMGRKPESLNVPRRPPAAPPAAAAGPGGGGAARAEGPGAGAPRPAGAPGAAPGGEAAALGYVPPNTGAGIPGDNFNRPTDVAWDAAGNIFVSDGYGNSRMAKFDKNGKFLKSWGQRGSAPGQFNTPHSMAVDAQGNVYVGDRGNRRIQVFDNNGEFKTQYLNVGAPWAICITPGPHQVLYTSNSNGTADMNDGEIYKMELDGKVLGKFGRAGKLMKEFGSVHEIDCRNENEIFVGEITNWRVQKLTLHPTTGTK